MARITANVALALILLNASANFLVAAGIAADWGIQPQPGGGEEIEKVEQAADKVDTQGGTSTLIGLYDSMATAFTKVIKIMYAGPTMLGNLGVPAIFVNLIFAPMYLLVLGDMVYILAGRVVF